MAYLDRLGGFLVWVVFALSLAARAYAADNPAQAIDALLAPHDRQDAPALTVGVYREGKVVYTRALGLEDIEYRQPATTETASNVASVSKQFTAFAIALLEREGKIDPSADIRTYLNDLPDMGTPVTVSDLVHHLSGLRDTNILLSLAQRDSSARIRQSDFIRMVERQRTLRYPAGTKFSYTNTGYILLAEIVRKVSGQTLRQFTAERIFKPLGMTHTFFRDDTTEIVPHLSESYVANPSGSWSKIIYNVEDIGATGLVTTVDDMMKWIANFDRPVVGDAALIAHISAPSKLRNGGAVNYGYGLWRQRYAGHDAITHDGSIAGYRSLMLWLPKERFGIAMTATKSVDLNEIATQILEICLGKGSPLKGQGGPSRENAVPIATTPALAKNIAGRYIPPDTWSVDLVESEGKLFWVSSVPFPKSEITLRTGDIFSRHLGDSLRWFQFVRDKGGRISGFRALPELGDQAGSEIFAKSDFYTLPSMALRELEGDYRSQDLDVTYTFVIKGDHLTAHALFSPTDVTLHPIAPDRFDADQIGMAAMKVERDAAGKPIGFLIVGGGLIGMKLERVGPP